MSASGPELNLRAPGLAGAAAARVFPLALFALLGSGIWIGLALLGVGWLGMELFTSRAGGDARSFSNKTQ